MKIDHTVLWEAWNEVSAKDSAGGIDRISINDFRQNQDKYLRNIDIKLKNQTYLPQAYLQIKISKDRNEKRILGLATVHDKIVQTAIKILVEQAFEKHFFASSYAYRPGLGPRKAVNKVRHYIATEKNNIIAKCDIDNYFDTINHNRLFKQLKPLVRDNYLLELIRMFIRMGYIERDNRWKERTEGVPQGAVLSPLLANLYLTPLDQRMHDRKIAYVRYADDFVILCKDRARAEEVLNETMEYITRNLKLKLNPGYFIRDASEGFGFLGVWITDKFITLSSGKVDRLRKKVKLAFRHPSFPKKYLDQIEGIANYYGNLIPQNILFPLDELIIDLWTEKLNRIPGRISKKQLKKALKPLRFVTDIYNRHIDMHRKNIIRTVYESRQREPITSAEQAVRIRRREYQRKFMENMHLHISGYGKSIGISKNRITVRNANRTITKYPTKNLRYITISARPASLSTEFINFCVQNGISVDLVKPNGQAYAKIFDFHHIYIKTWSVQEKITRSEKALRIAREILTAKITNQIRLMKYFGKYAVKTQEDIALFMPGALSQLQEILDDIRNVAPSEQFHERLMGLEGIASALYWQWFRMMIDEETDAFNRRITRKAVDPVNSMLNYGYAILYRHVWNSILAQGLHPEYGFLHTHQRGKASLVFDLIEPFRQPVVDRAVLTVINRKFPIAAPQGKIDPPTKQRLIKAIDVNLARYEKYLNKKFPLIDNIYRQTQHLRMHIMGQEKRFKAYKIIHW